VARKKTDEILSRQEWMEGWGDKVQSMVGAVYRAFGPLGRPLLAPMQAGLAGLCRVIGLHGAAEFFAG